MDVLGWAMQLALLALCVVAAVWDFKWQRIPNWLIMTGLVTGLFLRLLETMAGRERGDLADGILGMLAGGLPWLLADWFCYRVCGRRSIGGGDMKFHAMCGVFLGLDGVLLSYCVLAVLSVLILGVLCILGKIKRGDRVPYGPFLAAAAVIAGVFV